MFTIDLQNKVAWVLGASGEIGKAIALLLADSGCNVAITYNNSEDKAFNLFNEIESKGKKCLYLKTDIRDIKQCKEAYNNIQNELGSVDILVNSAGIVADNLFLMIEEEDWRNVLDINFMGAVNTSKQVINEMMYKRWGRIINISSAAGTKGGRGQSNYAASKGALEAMTRSLAVEVGKHGITVNCIAPGVVDTAMSKEVIKLAKSEILKRQIIKRFAYPEEIAFWVLVLCSKHSDFITGQIIHIDGGLKMP